MFVIESARLRDFYLKTLTFKPIIYFYRNNIHFAYSKWLPQLDHRTTVSIFLLKEGRTFLPLQSCDLSLHQWFTKHSQIHFFRHNVCKALLSGILREYPGSKRLSVCDYFHSPLFFLTPFVELKYGWCARLRTLLPGLNHTLEEGEYEPFCAHQEQNLIHAARNLNTRTLNNRANDDSLLHDSTAW